MLDTPRDWKLIFPLNHRFFFLEHETVFLLNTWQIGKAKPEKIKYAVFFQAGSMIDKRGEIFSWTFKNFLTDQDFFFLGRTFFFFLGCDFVSKINAQRERELQSPIHDVHPMGTFPRFQLKPSCWQQCTTKLSRNFVVSPVVNVENGILIGKKLGESFTCDVTDEQILFQLILLKRRLTNNDELSSFVSKMKKKNHNIRTNPERSHFDVNFFLYFPSFKF